jgi:Amt family ammonium transporter
MTMIGGGLLWVGWFGFNAGSSIASGLSTAQALTATQVAAASAAITWIIIENLHTGKATALGFVSGILAGLVAVTPAAGVVKPFGALILGILASALCYYAIIMKNKLGYDDSLDAFGIHGIGGIVGAIFLTFFIRESWMEDAALAAGGSWSVMQQLGVQVAAVLIAIVYAALITLAILWITDKLFGMRSSAMSEMEGLDSAYHGEHGYGMLNPN